MCLMRGRGGGCEGGVKIPVQRFRGRGLSMVVYPQAVSKNTMMRQQLQRAKNCRRQNRAVADANWISN